MTGILSGPATFTIDPAAVGDNTGLVVIKGNLQVDGTTTTINSTTLTVNDKNIELASVASPTDLTADGAGITIKGATDKTLNWVDATDAWTSSEDFNLLTGKKYEINGAEVLSSSKLTLNGSSSGTVAFQAAATAGSVTYTLPSADAAVSGYALVSNASGTLSWAAAGATISTSSSASTFYPVFASSTSGSLTTANVVSSGFTFQPSTGTLTVTALTESSSITLKENVNPLTNALDSILQLCGVSYDRRDGSRKNEVGLIAEEVNKIIPNLVTKGASGDPEGIQYSKLTAYLVEAIKSLKAEIDELKGNK
jgi:lipopolysaccharide export system protein LptA